MGVRSGERGRRALPVVAACTLTIVTAAGVAAWLWIRTGEKTAEVRPPAEADRSIAKPPARPRPIRPPRGGEWGRLRYRH